MDELNKGIKDTKAAIKALDDNIAHYEGLIANNELALKTISNWVCWTVAVFLAVGFVIYVCLNMRLI